MIRRRDPLAPPALAERLRSLASDERVFFKELRRVQRAWAC
jgi:hypothetical protein